MSTEIRREQRILYRGMEARVKDTTPSQLFIQIDGEKKVIEINPGEAIPILNPKVVFRDSEVAQIETVTWEAAERRADILRQILAIGGNKSEAVRRATDELQISERHVWRLLADYGRHRSIVGLLPKKPGRSPGSRMLRPDVEKVIDEYRESKFLTRERPTIGAAVESIAAICRDLGLRPPSRAAVKSRLRVEGREEDRCRNGAKAARYRHEPMPGHVEVSRPLERVEIDHTPMDLMVRSDEPLCNFVSRPWLTLAVDVYTRAVLGLHIGFEKPSILSVALCLTHAILPKNPEEDFGVPLPWPMHGLPEVVACDNAMEFDSHAFRRGCKELNIRIQFRPVGSPHYGGTIERLIGSFMGRCHLLPGTTKNSIRAKGDYASEKQAVLTLSQTRTWFVEEVLGRYHHLVHRTLGTTPAIAWDRAVAIRDAA
jgi:putative transposase